MIRSKKRLTLCSVLLLLNLVLIWGNSLATGESSGNLSGAVLVWINGLLGLNEQGAEILHLLIRKAAHFLEFACLGMLLGWRFGMAGCGKLRLAEQALLGGLLAACVDETIQIFVDGRASSLIDVWIDACGTAAGIIFLIIGHHLFRKKTHQDILEETK